MFAQWADSGMEIELPGAGRVCVPSDEMNRVYMLVHMYRHVFSEGIGLRQMMDYAMLLKRGCTEEEKAVFGRQAKELNLYGFACAVGGVCDGLGAVGNFEDRACFGSNQQLGFHLSLTTCKFSRFVQPSAPPDSVVMWIGCAREGSEVTILDTFTRLLAVSPQGLSP